MTPGQWRLKRTHQCAKCPWKVTTNPHDIPKGYSVDLHQELQDTIAVPGHFSSLLRAMACHESEIGQESFCVGWLHHQLGRGNNIALRLKLLSCTNAHQITVEGEQHLRFEDTLLPPDE